MTVQHRDYYDSLGVERNADAKTIKSAFRKLALQYHPDRNKDPEAENRFKEVGEAYAVLSNPEKRAAFDAAQARGASVEAPEDVFKDVDFRDLFRDLGFDFAGMGAFDRFMRQRRRAQAARGEDVEVAIDISLERVLTGGEESIRIARPMRCQACRGSGTQPGASTHPCRDCSGRGERLLRWREGGMLLQQAVFCSTCRGQGHVSASQCLTCRGHGRVNHEEKVSLTIPVGIEDGMILRVAGQGTPSPDPDGRPGDLFVVVHIAPDPRFERRGIDLWQQVTIPVVDSVLGVHIEVSTLQGPRRMSIPPGTQPEAVLRLRYQGLPEFGEHRRGHMYVRVRVHLPEQLTPRERELYEYLRTPTQKGVASMPHQHAPTILHEAPAPDTESEFRCPEKSFASIDVETSKRQSKESWLRAFWRRVRDQWQRWRHERSRKL